ncbi:MAG: hypothetical protein COB50_00745 [Thiotrichales bacterium]|nr:MAG: hypothetical protein COB50_00745 [Thiotrichales bacterium]
MKIEPIEAVDSTPLLKEKKESKRSTAREVIVAGLSIVNGYSVFPAGFVFGERINAWLNLSSPKLVPWTFAISTMLTLSAITQNSWEAVLVKPKNKKELLRRLSLLLFGLVSAIPVWLTAYSAAQSINPSSTTVNLVTTIIPCSLLAVVYGDALISFLKNTHTSFPRETRKERFVSTVAWGIGIIAASGGFAITFNILSDVMNQAGLSKLSAQILSAVIATLPVMGRSLLIGRSMCRVSHTLLKPKTHTVIETEDSYASSILKFLYFLLITSVGIFSSGSFVEMVLEGYGKFGDSVVIPMATVAFVAIVVLDTDSVHKIIKSLHKRLFPGENMYFEIEDKGDGDSVLSRRLLKTETHTSFLFKNMNGEKGKNGKKKNYGIQSEQTFLTPTDD